MTSRNTGDLPRLDCVVVDGDTLRCGASIFVRERTCRFTLEYDREVQAERAAMQPGEWTTRDMPLAWTCSECGHQYAPVAPFPAWIKHCPECGLKVVEP